MTEYELEDLLTSTTLAAVEGFGMYVTLLSAYLVASYLVGGRMDRMQVAVISSLFLVAATLMLGITAGYMGRAIVFADQLEILCPSQFYGMQPAVRYLVVGLQACGIVASLKFMWDIRNAKER